MISIISSLFRSARRNGHHRRTRVAFVQLVRFIWESVGDLLYYIGSSLVRLRRNVFRRIRHGLKRIAKVICRLLIILSDYAIEWASELWADLANPFIKGYRSIKGYHNMMAEIKEAPFRVKINRIKAFFKYGFMWNRHLIERFLSHVLPVICLILCIFIVQKIATLPFAIEVSVGGQDIGFIEEESVYDEAVAILQKRTIRVDDSDWKPHALLTISVADPSEVFTQNVIADKILLASGMDVSEATGIYIGGQFYGATTAGHLLSATVDSIIEPFRKEAEKMGDDVIVRFTRSIELVSGIFPANAVVPFESLRDILLSKEEAPIFYDGKDGDVVEEIAVANGITVSKLKEMNPEVDLSDTVLHEKVKLMVSEKDYMASVKTIRIEKEIVSINFNTHTTLSDSYNLGYYSIDQYGHVGEKTIVTELEYRNGDIVRRTVIEEIITEEPEDRYITIGTGGTGGTNMYGGSLCWPTSNFIMVSRGFTYGYHNGFDIAAEEYTPILAAESGYVELSMDTNYGYGRYVIIDHGNGMETVYGHMVQRLCSVGDYVARGQVIGLVGSTGNSTGPHLHFEVRINGERVPPEPYLGWS